MTFSRMRFPFTVPAGGTARGDTGYLAGALEQMSWTPDANDTGQAATLTLTLIPDETDTGSGWQVYSESGIEMGAGFNRAPRQAIQAGGDGTSDTGYAHIVGAGDRLRVTVTPADTGVDFSGAIYVWTR